MNEIILTIFLLNMESSYLQNIEIKTRSPADTVQFMLINGKAWRIRTYAIDHDVHVWSLGPMEEAKFKELVIANTEKHYGDVLDKKLTIATEKGFEGLREELRGVGVPEYLEVPESGEFAFWVPEPDVYKTKSRPEL